MVSEAEKKQFLNVFEEHFGSVDEEAQIILKGHLLIEEKLYTIISNFVFHPKQMEKAKLGFYQKIHLARSLSLDHQDNSMWVLILAINTLRNKISHKLAIEEREIPLTTLKELYVKEMEGDQFSKAWDDQGPVVGLSYTISLALGFLLTFEKESQSFKAMVENLDKVVNTHRHK